MSQQTHKWETTHDHVNRTMKIQFSDAVFAVVDWNSQKCRLVKDGKKIDCFSIVNYTLVQFGDYLLYVEQTIQTETLNKKV